MRNFVVIYEQADDGSWSAHAAELPVFAVGDTREEAEQMIVGALRLHIEELEASGGEVIAYGDVDVGIVAA